MSKIGDLFVRLGLKKDEFDKGIKAAQRETSSFGDFLKKIGSKGKLAFGAIALGVTTAISAVKALKDQNQKLGDAWDRTAAGMAASWDTFKTAVASMDFSHLFSDLREANRLARELYDARDALGEIGTSYNISLARQAEEINKLKGDLRDMNLSDEERIAAGEKLIEIYRKLETDPTRGLQNVSEKTLTQMAGKLGLKIKNVTDDVLKANQRTTEEFFIWLGTEQGEYWNSVYGNANNEYDRQLADFQARQAGVSKIFQTMLRNYQSKVGDKQRITMEEAVTAYYEQQAKFSGETLRIQTQINSLKASGKNDGSGGDTGDKGLAQAESILKRAQDSAKSEIQLLFEKYQTEKALLEQYGIDTYALTDEYFRNLRKIMEKGVDEAFEPLEKLEPIEVEPIEIDWSEIDAQAEEGMMEIRKLYEQTQELANAFGQAVATGFSSACEQLASQLMGLSDLNAGEVIKALLTPLADMAIKMGEIIMAEGIAMQAAKMALKNPITAIAAGAALIAIGAAAKAGLEAVAKGGTTTTSVGASGYSGDASTSRTQDLQTELVITVEGRLSGSDILLAGQKTLDSWGR